MDPKKTETQPREQIESHPWVKPSFERVSLNEALMGRWIKIGLKNILPPGS
jgi:hypothetical protein